MRVIRCCGRPRFFPVLKFVHQGGPTELMFAHDKESAATERDPEIIRQWWVPESKDLHRFFDLRAASCLKARPTAVRSGRACP